MSNESNKEKNILHLSVEEIKTIIIDEIHKNNALNKLLENFINKYEDITINVSKNKIILNQDFDAGNPVDIIEEILNSKTIHGHILIKKSPIYYLFEAYESLKYSNKRLNDYRDEDIAVNDELYWRNKPLFFRFINNKKCFLDRIKSDRQRIRTEFAPFAYKDNIYRAALSVVWFMIREGYFVRMHKKLKEKK